MALLASQLCSKMVFKRLVSQTCPIVQIPMRKVTVKSKLFDEYSVLYEFPQVKTATLFNKMKKNATIILACGAPSLHAVNYVFNVIPSSFVGSFIFFGTGITIFFHTTGYLFNNTIGYVYIHDDKEKLKISANDYWGKRIDIDTTISEVEELADSKFFKNPLYQTLKLGNSKEHFKFYVSSGHIMDSALFYSIFGRV